jgi:acyl-CoA thioester hydrolase
VRFTLQYEIRDDEELYVTARSVLVAYDVEREAPRRLTADEMSYLRRFAGD